MHKDIRSVHDYLINSDVALTLGEYMKACKVKSLQEIVLATTVDCQLARNEPVVQFANMKSDILERNLTATLEEQKFSQEDISNYFQSLQKNAKNEVLASMQKTITQSQGKGK